MIKCVVCGEDRPYLLDPHHVHGEFLSLEVEWVCKSHHALRHLEWSNVHKRRTSGGGRAPLKHRFFHWKYNPNVLTPRDLLPYFDQRREHQITDAIREAAMAAHRQTLAQLAQKMGLKNVPYLPLNDVATAGASAV